MADFEEAGPRPLAMICGTLKSKDTAAFLSHFKGLAREVLAVPIPGEHAARPAEEVCEIAARAGLSARVAGSVGEALDALAAQSWPVPPRVLIAGSLYLAGASGGERAPRSEPSTAYGKRALRARLTIENIRLY